MVYLMGRGGFVSPILNSSGRNCNREPEIPAECHDVYALKRHGRRLFTQRRHDPTALRDGRATRRNTDPESLGLQEIAAIVYNPGLHSRSFADSHPDFTYAALPMTEVIHVPLPQGFRAAGVHCGIKKDPEL